MQSVIDLAATKLTDNILGGNDYTLEQVLEEIATDAGLRHISYFAVCFSFRHTSDQFNRYLFFKMATTLF